MKPNNGPCISSPEKAVFIAESCCAHLNIQALLSFHAARHMIFEVVGAHALTVATPGGLAFVIQVSP